MLLHTFFFQFRSGKVSKHQFEFQQKTGIGKITTERIDFS